MDFLNNCVDLIEMIGNGLANFVDFIIKIPTLLNNLLKLLPRPFYDILGVFIGFVIVIILAKTVKMFFVK